MEQTILHLRSCGVPRIAVIGIGRYKDAPVLPNVEYHSYLDTSYEAFKADESACGFCRQDVPSITGFDFTQFEREIKKFDPYTFWALVGQNPNYFSVGHWPSDRTPNHFYFRILTDEVFRSHSYGLAIRIRNVLHASSGVLPGWIGKIVCIVDEESYRLSVAVASVLGLKKEDVVALPRELLNAVVGKQIQAELLPQLKDFGDRLQRQNVLIIDQAAHHFRTLSALRNVCEYYECVVLAFAVFVDRTDRDIKGEYLHDSHYVALYSWPCLPRRAYECQCVSSKVAQ